MATCVDVSGADYPRRYKGHAIKPMEGRSLGPAFEGRKIEREAIYWEHEGNRVRQAAKRIEEHTESPPACISVKTEIRRGVFCVILASLKYP